MLNIHPIPTHKKLWGPPPSSVSYYFLLSLLNFLSSVSGIGDMFKHHVSFLKDLFGLKETNNRENERKLERKSERMRKYY